MVTSQFFKRQAKPAHRRTNVSRQKANRSNTKIPKNPIPAKPLSPKSYQHLGKSPGFSLLNLGIIPEKQGRIVGKSPDFNHPKLGIIPDTICYSIDLL